MDICFSVLQAPEVGGRAAGCLDQVAQLLTPRAARFIALLRR